MEDEKTFSTTDFGFACYLVMARVDIADVFLKDRDRGICEFVFFILPESEEFKNLENNWYNTEDTKPLKDILHSSRILKGKLKICLLKNNVPRKI